MLFIVVLVPMMYLIVLLYVEKGLNKFTSGVKFVDDKLTLPTKIVINVGLIRIAGLWVTEGGGYTYDVKVINSKQLDTPIVDISELYSSTPYIRRFRWKCILYIETQGFIVRSPKEFKDVIALCIDTSRIRERYVELSIDDYPDIVK